MLRRGLSLWAPLAAPALSLALAVWLSDSSWSAQALWAVLLGRLAALFSFRLDRLEWGEWGFEEGVTWTLAAGVGGAVAAAVSAAAGRLVGPLFAAETLIYWSAGLMLEGGLRIRGSSCTAAPVLERPRRLLIYGSGPEARELAARLKRRPDRWEPYGYLDEDRSRLQATLDGLPVLGDLNALPRLARLYHVSDLFVPGKIGDDRIEELAELANVTLRAED